MALHYPTCEWVFSPAYLQILSHAFNETTEDLEIILAESLGPCQYEDFNYLSDAFVTSLIVMYSIIIPIGFLGNLVVILVILTSDKLHKTINYLLMAVAISDLMLSCTVAWTFIRNISYDYTMSAGLCRAIPPIQGMSVVSSIYTLVFVSVERHQAIINPNTRFFNSTKRVVGLVAAIWICSLCLQIPQIIVLDVVPWNYTTVVFENQISYQVSGNTCMESWSLHQSWVYSIFIVIFAYGLPLIVLAIVYGKIGHFIRARRQQVDHMLSLEASSRSRTRQRKLMVMLIGLVVIFCLFWGPYFILQCLQTCLSGYCNPVIYSYLQLIGHMSIAVDPILYAFLHERFRKEFLTKVQKLCKCCSEVKVKAGPNNSYGQVANTRSDIPTIKTRETNFQQPNPPSENNTPKPLGCEHNSPTLQQNGQNKESPFLPRPKSAMRRRESVDHPHYIPGIVVNN